MGQNIITKQLTVNGMTCAGCEMKIEKKLKAVRGVIDTKASYGSGKVSIVYDEGKVNADEIKQMITALGYDVSDQHKTASNATPVKAPQLALIAIIILGAFLVVSQIGGLDIFSHFPQAQEGMGYAAIFVIGLLTSVHCVGMCGGINLSQCLNAGGANRLERLRPSFLYNLGRVVSYTVIGAIVGALGSIISFSGVMRGGVALFAGVFMIIMGLKMLNIFPWLRRLNLRLPQFLTRGVQGNSNSPLYVGLLNGLMPCGPLQAMQLYALSTGDPVKGAVSMFLFSIGTVPLMFGLGAVSSILSRKFTARAMAVSAVLVIILGAGMLNTGLNMAGFLALGTETSGAGGFEPVVADGYQIVTIEVAPRSYAPITVKKDIPVKFNLHVEEKYLNGCNNAIIIPQYDVGMQLSPGDNIVEFTPDEAGVFPYSCWMNMIRSSITVVD